MIPHPVAVPPYVDDVAVMDQPVDQGCSHDLVAEHAAPFLEALVRRQNRRRPFVPGVDELEEQHGTVLADRQVADFVDHQEGRMRQHTQPAGQVAGSLRVGEGLDQPGETTPVPRRNSRRRRNRLQPCGTVVKCTPTGPRRRSRCVDNLRENAAA